MRAIGAAIIASKVYGVLAVSFFFPHFLFVLFFFCRSLSWLRAVAEISL